MQLRRQRPGPPVPDTEDGGQPTPPLTVRAAWTTARAARRAGRIARKAGETAADAAVEVVAEIAGDIVSNL